MNCHTLASFAVGFSQLFFVCFVSQIHAAVDLAKIGRAIGKLPGFHSSQPEYCLLVFGPEATKRVWLIRDGDTLYVDRNGNGDLTEADEAVKASTDSTGDAFKAGNIPDGRLEHKSLYVSWMAADHLRNRDTRVRALLDKNPNWWMCMIMVDVEMPGQLGAGYGGRVPHSVSYADIRGIFQFSADPRTAPIVHFGGPWEITFYGSKDDWHVDQTEKPYLAVGTPGLGPGTTAYVDYQAVIPATLKPKLQVTFPRLDGHAAVTKSYELDRRCCGVNLYGDIRIPPDIGTGKAEVQISIPNWPGTTVAVTTHEVKILPAAARPKLEPVSKRFLGALEHVNKPLRATEARLIDIQFSPNGKRLIAGETPSGMVQMWDIGSRQTLRTFDTGARHYLAPSFFTASLDWQTLFATTYRKNYRYEKIERDGKTLYRYDFDDSILRWNLDSGVSLRPLQHSPPRNITELQSSPDGKQLLTNDAVPGTYEGSYPIEIAIWNVADGTYRKLPDGVRSWYAFSSDGKHLAAALCPNLLDGYCTEIKIFDCASLAETAAIKLPEGKYLARPQAFLDGNSTLVGCVHDYTVNGDWKQHPSSIKFWDTTSGREVASISAPEKGVWLTTKLSPDKKTMAVACSNGAENRGRTMIIDLATHLARVVDYGEAIHAPCAAYHPSGKWLAVGTTRYNELLEELPVEQRVQPRIQIVDVDQAEIVEAIISPQAIVSSLAFSPDGKTLATSGNGEVLLWDFSASPGQVSTQHQ